MKVLLLFVLVAGGDALPRRGRQDGAEVIRVVDEKSPILLSSPQQPESDNNIVPLVVGGNGTVVEEAVSSPSPQQPTPVPEDVAITTEKFEKNTPALVPAVVDIATPSPGNTPTPPAPANGTTPVPEEEESDEDGSEEADEENSGEDEDEDDDEEEDDEDEEEEDEEEAKYVKIKRHVAGEEVPSSVKEPSAAPSAVSEEASDEEDGGEKVATGDKAVDKKKEILKATGLQALPGNLGAGEDDEADSALLSNGKPSSVVIASSKV